MKVSPQKAQCRIIFLSNLIKASVPFHVVCESDAEIGAGNFFYLLEVKVGRQRSGNGAIRKKFPLGKN